MSFCERILHDTGVVEFATLTAMEAVLIASIAAVILLMFWSEFLHMYRRVRDFFVTRSEQRQLIQPEPELDEQPAMLEPATATAADLGVAS